VTRAAGGGRDVVLEGRVVCSAVADRGAFGRQEQQQRQELFAQSSARCRSPTAPDPLSPPHDTPPPPPPPPQQILAKESYTLEELLDEDDIIQECKSLNESLLRL
jgi:hypothetical protein